MNIQYISKKIQRFLLCVATLGIFGFCNFAYADCIVGATLKMKYQVLDSHTILLSGGVGKSILIKSFSFFHSSSQVSILKDSFCDYETGVLYVDGQLVDVQQVKSF